MRPLRRVKRILLATLDDLAPRLAEALASDVAWSVRRFARRIPKRKSISTVAHDLRCATPGTTRLCSSRRELFESRSRRAPRDAHILSGCATAASPRFFAVRSPLERAGRRSFGPRRAHAPNRGSRSALLRLYRNRMPSVAPALRRRSPCHRHSHDRTKMPRSPFVEAVCDRRRSVSRARARAYESSTVDRCGDLITRPRTNAGVVDVLTRCYALATAVMRRPACSHSHVRGPISGNNTRSRSSRSLALPPDARANSTIRASSLKFWTVFFYHVAARFRRSREQVASDPHTRRCDPALAWHVLYDEPAEF